MRHGLIRAPQNRVQHRVRRVLVVRARELRVRGVIDRMPVLQLQGPVGIERDARVVEARLVARAAGDLLDVEAPESRDAALQGRGDLLGVDVGRDVVDGVDEAGEEVAGAVVARVLAEDAEEKGGAEAAVDGGPGLARVGGDVVEAEEGLDGVDEVLHAEGFVGCDELAAGVAGADRGAEELGEGVGCVEVQCPVLQGLLG